MNAPKTKLVACPSCKDQGTHRDPKSHRAIKCERCDGKGVISVPDE
jgi:DnaJ-class molecular chaperone